MPNYKGKRSQVDAPMELVIAIIILLASLSIALLIFNSTDEQRCIAELKSEVRNLQNAMQDLALQSPPSTRSVIFRMPSCGGERVDALRFVYYSKPEFCRLCSGHLNSCWKLELASYKPDLEKYVGGQISQADVCVDVSGEIDLQDMSKLANPAVTGCIELSNNPCPPERADECTASMSGKPKNVFDDSNPLNSPSRWQTLGREARIYEIILRKGFSTGGVCIEASCPAIEICAKNAVEET
ncbi:MAG: hypothetical protein ABH863_00205 [Candidatus Micrarchaeota archaeon]